MNYKKSIAWVAFYALFIFCLYWFEVVSFERISPLWVCIFAAVVQTIVYLTYIKGIISKANVDKFLGMAMFAVLLVSGLDYMDDFLVVGFVIAVLSPIIQIMHSKLAR